MAKQIKSRTITLSGKEGTFSTIFHKFKGDKKNSGVANLRQLFSDERARIIHICKTKQPASIYELAKLLGRDFKAVRSDIKLLEQFGIIELISSMKKGRERLRPVVDTDELVITLKL
jgi:predicted transcriptional regulator